MTGTTTLSGATAVNNTFGVTGTTTLSGATTINNTLNVDTNSSTTGGSTISANNSEISLISATGTAGSSNLALKDGKATLSSGTSAGFNTYDSDQTVIITGSGADEYQMIHGDAETKSLVDGAQVRNVIAGNTLIDGSLFVNGPIVQSSSTSVDSVVTSGSTSGGLNAAVAGQSGFISDSNGKITAGVATQTVASLTVTNEQGNTHGFYVDEQQAVISGGTRSSSLTLNDNGATFSNSATGAPVQVHGVADGSAPNDAVNVRQLNNVADRAYSGIAQIAAMQAIPEPIAGKRYSLGVGSGFYAGEQAIAFGGKANVLENINVGASVSTGFGSSSSMAASVGVGFSW